MAIRVVVVGDQEMIRLGLHTVLETVGSRR